MTEANKPCGECSMCCKLPAIEGFKPANRWCTHCKPGQGGCGIYDQARPDACGTYRCAWKMTAEMGPDLRPDRFGGIFETVPHDPFLLVFRIPADKYTSILQRVEVMQLLKMFVRAGTKIVLTDSNRQRLFEKDEKNPLKWALSEGHIHERGAAGLHTYHFTKLLDGGFL